MRKTCTFLAAVLMVYNTDAKTSSISVPTLFPYFGSSMPVITQPGSNSSRIVGKAYSTYDGSQWQPVDSTTYSYAWGRGGELDEDYVDDFVNFEDSYTYVYDGNVGGYVNRLHRYQTYNALGRALSYTCQSWKATMGSWRDSSRFLYTYNNDNTRLQTTDFQIYYGGIWADHVYYNNTFDASDRVIEMSSNVYHLWLTYDAAGNISQRIDKRWTSTTGWQYFNRLTFTYNGSGLSSYIVEFWDGSAWTNAQKFEYSYVGADVSLIKESHWEATTANWASFAADKFTYDAAHNKLSDEYQQWDSAANDFVSSYMLSWTYNNHDQPVSYSSKTWDAASSSWILTEDDFTYRYYYQEYVSTGTDDFPKTQAATLNIYPQPAVNELNVSLKLDKPQSYTLLVYDVQGHLIRQHSETAADTHVTLPVNDLASGSYWLRLTTVDQTIARQFIVGH